MAAEQISPNGGETSKRKTWRKLVAKATLPLAATTAIGMADLAVTTPQAEASTGHSISSESHKADYNGGRSINVFLSSRVQATDTGVFVQRGQEYDLAYQSGEWTVGGEQNYSGPEGLDGYRDRNVWRYGDEIGQSCRVVDGPYGEELAFFGRPGGDPNFSYIQQVGRGGHFRAPVSGELYLGINDNDYVNKHNQQHCLGDNRNLNGEPIVMTLTLPDHR